MKYYATERPIGPGALPEGYEPTGVCNFGGKTYVKEIGREAYGYVDYDNAIPEQEAKAYELIPEGMKVWYSVTSIVRDSGKVTAHITTTKTAIEKPENSHTSLRDKDIYVDWFGSWEEADAFAEGARKA